VPLPATERLTRDSLILPLFHDLDEADQDHIIDVVCGALTDGAQPRHAD
jgi:perosamine synthetase